MGAPQYRHVDLHIHSRLSDGSDSPEALVENVRAAGLDLFSLTDHDCTEGCALVQALLQPGDPRFLYGIELSCQDEIGKYHVLGYCYDPDHPAMKEAAGFAHYIREQKVINRFAYLEEHYGFSFTPEEKASVAAEKNPGRPHFAALLLKKGLIQDKSEGFEMLADFRGSEPMLAPEKAIAAVLEAGGIPVLAHGILDDGSKNLTEEQITARVERFVAVGLQGLECYYSTYTPEQKRIMLSLAERFDLMITAGSDYHGANKPVQLGDTNDPDYAGMERFFAAIG